MKQLKRSWQALSKDLKSLNLRTEKMMKLLDKLEKVQTKTVVRKKKAAKKVVPKRVITKKGKGPSATETVLKIIMRSKKGVGTRAIQEKTRHSNIETLMKNYVHDDDQATPYLEKIIKGAA